MWISLVKSTVLSNGNCTGAGNGTGNGTGNGNSVINANTHGKEDVNSIIQDCMQYFTPCFATICSRKPDCKSLKSLFNWMSVKVSKKTFKLST